jgi:hypothetical protein
MQVIPQGNYVLIGSNGYEHWVVGKIRELDWIEKVSVVRMTDAKERERFERLDVGQWLGS